jgi:hypothetical protein
MAEAIPISGYANLGGQWGQLFCGSIGDKTMSTHAHNASEKLASRLRRTLALA